MRSRLRKKRARLFAASFTVAEILAHARPSFHRLGRRKRTQLVRWAARTQLGCSRAQCDAVRRHYSKRERVREWRRAHGFVS